MKNNAQYLKKRIKYCREWVAKNSENIKARGEAYLDNAFASADASAALDVYDGSNKLAYYFGIRGMVGVLDGVSDAWADIDRSVTYHYWHVRVAAANTARRIGERKFAEQGRLYMELPIAASVFCYAIVNENEEWQRELAHFFSEVVLVPEMIPSNYWNGHGKFEAFLLRLLGSLKRIDPIFPLAELPDVDISPLDEIIDTWEEPAALAIAIYDACEYHCLNMSERNSHDPLASFRTPPFDLTPYEIMAIYKLRAQCGRVTPVVDHPLLETPLWTPQSVALSDVPLQRLQDFCETRLLQSSR